MAGYFTDQTFKFLRDLEANNNRPWFQENKSRYEEHVKRAAIEFITDFAPHLHKVSPRFVADPSPVGGSLFRIYRDTRFSKSKTPYKTSVGIRFTHEMGKNVHAPGYYLHIANDGVWAGCGIWHPESEPLRKIREAIVEDGAAWKRARNGKRFSNTWSLVGESLKRAPKGFDAEHPLIVDLRRKDFIATTTLTKKRLMAPDLPEHLASLCRDGASLQRFLCRALGIAY